MPKDRDYRVVEDNFTFYIEQFLNSSWRLVETPYITYFNLETREECLEQMKNILLYLVKKRKTSDSFPSVVLTEGDLEDI